MSPLTTTTSPSLKLDSQDFKSNTRTGDPPSPPSMQESVQMLTREDVAVKLMDGLGKEKRGDDSEVWRDQEKAVNGRGDERVNEEEAQEEDHVDGLLSPVGEISMIEHQDDIIPGSTARHDTTSQREDLTEEGQEVSSTPLISDDKSDYPSSIPVPNDNAPTSPSTPSLLPKSTSPKPPHRYPIANRRLKGWISSLNHPRAVSSLSNQDITLTPPRSSSTSDLPRGRISSVHVHQQPSIPGGRRISGAMQYAFQSQSQSRGPPGQVDDESQVIDGDGDQGGNDEREEDTEEVIGLAQEQLSPEEEARIRYEVGLSQDQDEIWMEYVRNQLSSLFPDFFGADPSQLGAQMGESSFQGPQHDQSEVNDEYDAGLEEIEVERRGSPLYEHP
ncbi:hypothetical protein I302_109103 [Kwoniella bestiolae CBS 10118]|uniref:Uncharacterized protein n=1 Tax=Kwoniella bestiolae CBS 10118 TaxID=1296100 RepID=A0A1B9FV13_9TREE|nr:hypothetical protein I302_08248 [Kwoniella bestiolae CBS 10118]OCF22598.1 hypothetical protein I302_08248 [Kwoniella bestiolae CBS 10118]